MLILARYSGDEVVITVPPSSEASSIVVKVLKGSVKLGFEAPDQVNIVRSELLESPKGDS